MTDRKTPGVTFWATVVVVVVLAAYPLSFGPWCWCTSRLEGEVRSVPPGYRPITLLAELGRPAGHAIRWYASLCAPDDWELFWSPYGGREWFWARSPKYSAY
jgi:hypothetical protein